MKFLFPSGGSHPFGTFINPGIRGIPEGVSNGKPWAADNGAYSGLNEDKFMAMLTRMEPYKTTCLFVVVPDCVGNAAETLLMFAEWAPKLSGWPLAFVAQDGMEMMPMPDGFSTLFIGGSTEWKESHNAIECIKWAQAFGKHVHVGRVNYGRRYRLFAQIEGSEEFTCDGTRQRYERNECIKDWLRLQNERSLPLW
jgi:hypothetical protein